MKLFLRDTLRVTFPWFKYSIDPPQWGDGVSPPPPPVADTIPAQLSKLRWFLLIQLIVKWFRLIRRLAVGLLVDKEADGDSADWWLLNPLFPSSELSPSLPALNQMLIHFYPEGSNSTTKPHVFAWDLLTYYIVMGTNLHFCGLLRRPSCRVQPLEKGLLQN